MATIDMLDIKPGHRSQHALDARTSLANHDGRPRVSVVSVMSDDATSALRHVSERAARWERWGVELIIVCNSRRSTGSTVSAIAGRARLIYGPADASDADLRAIGLAAATGDVVMLVDDPATANEEWIEHVSITGAVREDDGAAKGEATIDARASRED